MEEAVRSSSMNKGIKVTICISCLLVVSIGFLVYTNMAAFTFTSLRDTWSPLVTNNKTTIRWKVPPFLNSSASSKNISFRNGGRIKSVVKDTFETLEYDKTKSVIHNADAKVPTNRTKVTRIAFLKVHKAASTTIQNMLFRFGIKHDLNILLPKKGNHIWSKGGEMPIRKGQHYDIFAIHTIYNKTFFDSLLPANYVNIGIVREPLSRTISAAYYHRDLYGYKYLMRVPRANYFHNLINFPELYDPDLFSQTRNTMAEDFGFSDQWESQADIPKIKSYLDELNFRFLFVMIMEKFDESLVYLRRLLNWSICDILYIKTNSYKHPPVVLNKTEKIKFRRTNSLDFAVYKYFSEVFDEKLMQVPADFWEEVTYFKKLLKGVNLICALRNSTKPRIRHFPVKETKFSEHFNVTSTDCDLMTTAEMTFINNLRQRHIKRQNLTPFAES